MIQTQQFEGFPVFGDNSTKSQPEAAIYSNGFAPADVLPAEYYNWLTNKASVGITDLNRGLSSVEEELNNVVTAGGEEPTEETSKQVITAIKYLITQAKNEAILAAHPVGSLYWSSKNTNPSQLFGGTWTQIKDKFILAAGDTYINGATGGAATVTLTTNQIPSHTHTGPSHTHSFTPSGTITGGEHTHTGPSHTHSFTPSGTITGGEHTHTGPSHTHSFTPSGNVASHTHTINSTNTNSSGTIENAGFRGIEVTSGNMSTNATGSVVGYGTENSHNWALKSVSGCFSSSGEAGAVGASKKTLGIGSTLNINVNHTHKITPKGYLYGQTDETTPTFTGTLGTTVASGTGSTGKTTPSMYFTGRAGTTGAAGTGATGEATPSMTFTGKAGTTGAAGTGATGSTGGGAAHNNMPPYVVKYCWERTA
jgi:hypothetical protein